MGALIALLQQWQVIVAAIAAATALWFGFEDQRRKQLETNRIAVAEAKKETVAAEFLRDPHNTLVEFRATYPEHAFCAVLGYFVAEASRRADPGGANPAGAGAVREMNDAISAQIERIAAQGGLTRGAIEEAAKAAAGNGEPDSDACPGVRPAYPMSPRGLIARAGMWRDCRLLIDTYAQASCQILAAEQGREALAATVAAVGPAAAGTDAPRPPAEPEPEPAFEPEPTLTPEPAPQVEPPADAPPTPAAGPAPDCGAAPPTLFLQFVAVEGREEAERVRAALSEAGWPTAPVELVAGGRTSGDVRYYWEEQARCAGALAAALGPLVGTDTFAPISLVGRYRGLPRDRLEVWLPAPASYARSPAD